MTPNPPSKTVSLCGLGTALGTCEFHASLRLSHPLSSDRKRRFSALPSGKMGLHKWGGTVVAARPRHQEVES